MLIIVLLVDRQSDINLHKHRKSQSQYSGSIGDVTTGFRRSVNLLVSDNRKYSQQEVLTRSAQLLAESLRADFPVYDIYETTLIQQTLGREARN
jgi:hypothetical protein